MNETKESGIQLLREFERNLALPKIKSNREVEWIIRISGIQYYNEVFETIFQWRMILKNDTNDESTQALPAIDLFWWN